jgi:DNA-binding beta-propeller fold protein YncE
LLQGWSIETIAFHPTTGHLWVAADRRSDSTFHANYSANSFYAIDLSDNSVVDSFSLADIWDPALTLPRGMAFSPTGDTVYVAHFDNGAVPAVARFIRQPASSVERVDDVIPSGFALQQNFPNPFNPSTEIRFDIGRAGFTTLRVYDMLGREVAQLVNEELEVGTYTATFDASRLTSGTYVYEVVSGGVRLTKKMMLLK